MCGSREWYLGVVSFCAWRALILWYASTNIRLTATAAFIHCVYVLGLKRIVHLSYRIVQVQTNEYSNTFEY